MWLALFFLAGAVILMGFREAASLVMILAALVFLVGGGAVLAGVTFVALTLLNT